MCMRGGAETTTLFKFNAVLLVAAVVVIVMVGLLDDRFHLFIEQVESARRELAMRDRREKKRDEDIEESQEGGGKGERER